MKKSVYGVGINDLKLSKNPLYKKWAAMLERCYSEKRQKQCPSYIGCTVCDEWLVFSCFKAWAENQDWQGKELDKDILSKGNKVYSPEKCVFVDYLANRFIEDCPAARGDCLLGVDFHKQSNKFRARCSNPFTGKREHLGFYDCQNNAHIAWKKRKHELACQLAEMQSNSDVANALRIRYI